MFLRDKMEHNKFDYSSDIVKPIRFFLDKHNILASKRKSKFNGYFDKRAIKVSRLTGIENKSQYYNNYDNSFLPQMPKLD